MPLLTKEGQLRENDPYQLISEPGNSVPAGPVILPLQVWIDEHESLDDGSDSDAVWVGGDLEADELVPHLSTLSLIAIHFPNFTDGRGYSLARILRDEHDYQGELRAIGDVLPDQLYYLKRCGFDTFLLSESCDVELAKSALGDFEHAYQAASSGPTPLIRRG